VLGVTERSLTLPPGHVVGMVGSLGSGLTRVGLALLATPARRGLVAFLDVRGWLCPLAAWECGVPPDRLVVVRCPDRRLWPQVAAALLDGVPAVYAEVPAGVGVAELRRLAALARVRKAAVILRPLHGELPAGLTYVQLRAGEVSWEGPEAGHGRLRRRRVELRLSGRGVGGQEAVMEVEDDGADALRVVPGLVTPAARRAAG
jgi:hypothetical protein